VLAATGRGMDRALDVGIALVAWWSVFYWVGLATQWSLWPSGWLWLLTSPVVAWLVVHLDRADEGRTASAGGWRLPGFVLRLPGLTWAALGVAGLLAVACLRWPASFRVVWVLLLVGTVVAALARVRAVETSDLDKPDQRGHLAALLLALATAVLSLYILLPDLDDPYYLNRSVWVAEHGTAALRDTMFGPERIASPYNGGLPIDSIEALVGVLSHLTGIRSGTLTWVGLTFVGSFATVWAFWRLSRCWARRTPLAVLVVALAFMWMSGESRLGNFWVARMWQGKVLALTVLVPLVWVWATDLAEGRQRRRALVMLLVGGAAFVGFTSTAVLLAPIMTGAMLVAAVLRRDKVLALGGVLFSVVPVLGGAASVLYAPVGGAHPALLGAHATFLRVFGHSRPMVALALAGVVVGVLALRSATAAVMVAAAWTACLVVYVPGLLPVVNAATGAGPVLWRTFYCVPVAVLVGLAATLALPRVPALLGPAVAVALVAVLGAPLWTTTDHNGPVTMSSSPSWKVDQRALADVEHVMASHPHGVVVLPPTQMRVLAMYTTQAYAVVPRTWYAKILDEPKDTRQARFLLSRLASAHAKRLPGPVAVAHALEVLHVSLACTARTTTRRQAVAAITGAGFGDPRRYGHLTCVRRL